MILHCVFCKVAPDVGDVWLETVAALEAFSYTLAGVLQFDQGPNRDFEALSPDITHGFVIRFDTRDALAVYAEHPDHKRLGSQLLACCVGGIEGLVVVDLEVEP